GWGRHRAPRSFPPRRSSDLTRRATATTAAWLAEQAGEVGHDQKQGGGKENQACLTQLGLVLHGVDLLLSARSGSGSQCCRVETGDRKSTRLNSSHVKISYAV